MGINERARGGLNWAEKVLHALPGFQGYCERELRRDADRLQREFIAQKLQKVKDVMAEAINVAGRQQKMDLLSGYDELTRLLERTLNEIRYSDRGYSAFFDLIKIKEKELESVYRCDAELIEMALQFEQSANQLAANPLDGGLLRILQSSLKTIAEQLGKRAELLQGYR